MNTEDYRERVHKALKDVHRQGLHEDSGNGEPCYCLVEPTILSLIQEAELKGRIEENNMYLKDTSRHYYPSMPNEPHIPLVQFRTRLKELNKGGEK